MKRIFILLTLMACMTGIHAQEDADYRPFIEEGKVWLSYNYIGGYRSWCGEHWEYDYFDGDTIVAGRACKIWRQRYVSMATGEEHVYTMSAYEEDKKVWFYHDGETPPLLAYDFGAEVGDTIYLGCTDAQRYDYFRHSSPQDLDFYIHYVDTLVVRKKDTLSLYGIKQNAIWFNTLRGIYLQPEYFLVGVGSIIMPSHNWARFPSTLLNQLIYCIKGDDILYVNQYWLNKYKIQIPSAVHSPHPVLIHSDIYDLTGRRLSARPAKGLYIEDGKVKSGK